MRISRNWSVFRSALTRSYFGRRIWNCFRKDSMARRCIAVHPTLPVFLTCSDDTLIKLWDWDKVGLGHPPGCCIAV